MLMLHKKCKALTNEQALHFLFYGCCFADEELLFNFVKFYDVYTCCSKNYFSFNVAVI